MLRHRNIEKKKVKKMRTEQATVNQVHASEKIARGIKGVLSFHHHRLFTDKRSAVMLKQNASHHD